MYYPVNFISFAPTSEEILSNELPKLDFVSISIVFTFYHTHNQAFACR